MLWYQLAVSAVVMLPLSPLLGEPGIVSYDALTPPVLLALAYQGVIVAFRQLSRVVLAAATLCGRPDDGVLFLTPIFGVLFGVLFLGDPLTPSFLFAAACVAAGILLVNMPQKEKS